MQKNVRYALWLIMPLLILLQFNVNEGGNASEGRNGDHSYRKVSYDGAVKSMKLSEATVRPKKLIKVAMVAI